MLRLFLSRGTAALLLFLAASGVASADGTLTVTYFDVGQGDAALVQCPDGRAMLIDSAGDSRDAGSRQALIDAMEARFPKPSDRNLEAVVASHPHQDHVGAMDWVLENFAVKLYVDNGQPNDSARSSRATELRKKLVKAKKMRYLDGRNASGETIDVCPDLTVRLMEPWANDEKLTDTNDRSVAVRVDYGDTSFLFTGDIEGKAEASWQKQAIEKWLNVDVLKVGHHGSETSSTQSFIDAISPKIVVISSGDPTSGTNKRFKHPRTAPVERLNGQLHDGAGSKIEAYDSAAKKWILQSRNKGLWVTRKDGEITITSDGKEAKVTKP